MLNKRNILILIAGVCAIAMVVGAVMIFTITSRYRQSANFYTELVEQFLSFDPEDARSMPEAEGRVFYIDGQLYEEEMFELPDNITLPVVDFDALREINPNVVGWIWLEGTPINYPVVHWEDNYRYLTHLFNGQWNPSGAIFVDTFNSPGFVDPHTIIYGHHMNDGSMFAALERYNSQAFFDDNPYIFLLTPERNYVIKPFAGYLADVQMASWELEFDGLADLEDWIEYSRSKSDFISDVEVRGMHRIITLSTCSMAFYDARYVVAGRSIPIRTD